MLGTYEALIFARHLGRLKREFLQQTVRDGAFLVRNDHHVDAVLPVPHVRQRQVHVVKAASIRVFRHRRAHVANARVPGSNEHEINKCRLANIILKQLNSP